MSEVMTISGFCELTNDEKQYLNGGRAVVPVPVPHVVIYDNPKDAAKDALWIAGGAVAGASSGPIGATLGAIGGMIGAVGNSLVDGKCRIY